MNLDWLFWAGGDLFIALGLVLLSWSLFWDRSKGKRRCPKCWYDMSGTPGSLTCSECGKTVKRERKFFKTRRRWRWTVVAVLIGLVGIAGTLTPRVRRDGWESLIPTTALVVLKSRVRIPITRTTVVLTSGMTTYPPAATPTPYVYTVDFIEETLYLRMQKNASSDPWRCGLQDWHWRMLINRALSETGAPSALQNNAVDGLHFNENVLIHAVMSGKAQQLGLFVKILGGAVPDIAISGHQKPGAFELTEWQLKRKGVVSMSLFSGMRAIPRNPPEGSLGVWIPRQLQVDLNPNSFEATTRWVVGGKAPPGRHVITFDLVVDSNSMPFMSFPCPASFPEPIAGSVEGIFDGFQESVTGASP